VPPAAPTEVEQSPAVLAAPNAVIQVIEAAVDATT
jgi:hypothetical protein